MSLKERTVELLCHLASRPGHDEVKADFRELLIDAFGAERQALDFERRVPEIRGRLDALIGRTVFEAKRNLDREWSEVVRRMPEYLADRENEEGARFVGLASDGLKWVVFERAGEDLVKVKETTLDPAAGESFLAWLDGALALKTAIPPDALNVRNQLGPGSPAYQRAAEALGALWRKLKNDPAVALKRQIWAQLLKLVYGREVESDALFFQHTFLVIVAKAIALAVLGLRDDEPRRVLSGAAFEGAGILGAAESDFFDWVVADAEGEALVRRILNHVRRFRLDKVETDVLKGLYESLIERAERHGLGEYYTPDWLAAKIVHHAVQSPLEQHVLDPACGSGTFLFHAVRLFLAEAEEAGVPLERRAAEATALIAGLDIHPVAVIIARVTYLLALAPVIRQRRGPVSIPVHLSDAMQLSVVTMMGAQELRVEVPPAPNGEGAVTLIFPEAVSNDPVLFDRLIEAIRDGAANGLSRDQVERQFPSIFREVAHENYVRERGMQPKRQIGALEERAFAELGDTYDLYVELLRQGRDSIWTYVARNLTRPFVYSYRGGWANVIVGNPPWVAFRYMRADLQTHFRDLAKTEGVHVGGRFATQNDLSALFTVRAASLYLRAGGRLAFVLPLAALTRGQFEKLREGAFASLKMTWDEAWTVDASLEALPLPSCVLFGRKRARAKPVPARVKAFSGTLPFRDAPEDVADRHLIVEEGAPRPAEGVFEGGSTYRRAFRQGATLVPRMLCLIERRPMGRIGPDPAAPYVASRRNAQEKPPWKSLAGIEGRVEAEFLHPILLGESILPYRIFRPFEGVVPVTPDGEILDSNAALNRHLMGLFRWMRAAEKLWQENAASDLALVERWNYHNELGAQFPLAPLRVAYAKAGTLPAACVIRGDCVIDHKLYWFAPASEEEAYYLSAILNSETVRSRTAALQSRGQWGARDFDKVMFTLSIPRFDSGHGLHRDLAAAARKAEETARSVMIPENVGFRRARKLVRDALREKGIARPIDELVAQLLDRRLMEMGE